MGPIGVVVEEAETINDGGCDEEAVEDGIGPLLYGGIRRDCNEDNGMG
jgi:hypothetical protein